MSFIGRLASTAKAFCGLTLTASTLTSTLPNVGQFKSVTPILSRFYCTPPVYDHLETLHLQGPVIKKR